MHKMISAVACLFMAGCSHWQLNQNTGDLATSLGSLEKRQIVSNLVRAINNDDYIPSQVVLSLGSASTANGITPTFGLPFGSGFSSTGTMGTGSGAPTTSVVGGATFAAPTLSLQVSDTWNQSWTMSPPSDPGQLGRLREIYLFVSGYAQTYGKTQDEINDARKTISPEMKALLSNASDADRQKAEKAADAEIEQAAVARFLCSYPTQSLAVNFAAPIPTGNNVSPTNHPPQGAGPSAVNLVYTMKCKDEKAQVTTNRTVYADPTFLTGSDCVICLDVTSWQATTCIAPAPIPPPVPPAPVLPPVTPAPAGSSTATIQLWGGISVDWRCLSINPRLKFRLVHSDDANKSRTSVGSEGTTSLYVDPKDQGKFGDLAMFTHQALSLSAGASSGSAGGKATGANIQSIPAIVVRQ